MKFDAAQFQKRPKILRDLGRALWEGGEFSNLLSTAPVQGKAGKRERNMYSQRLDAHKRFIVQLLTHVDYVTHDICRAANKQFFGIKLETLAEKLHLCPRRVDRLVADLHAVGVLQSWKRCEDLGNGTVRGHTSVRKLDIGSLLALCAPALAGKWERFRARMAALRRGKTDAQQTAQKVLGLRAAQARTARNAPPSASPKAPRLPMHDTAARSLGSLLDGLQRRAGAATT